MASNWWNRFNQSWATNGLLDDPVITDSNSGWAYIGQSPPTVEQFNSVFQWNDKKDNWLYNQIANAIIGSGGTPSEGDFNGLLDSINEIVGAGAGYLPLTGGTLTGFLTLHAQPTNPFHAATKSYIDGMLGYALVPTPPGGYGNGMLQPYGSGQYRLMLSNSTFIIPAGVSSIRVRVVGAGGTSAGQYFAAGGGEYAHGVFTVTPGTSYAVTVGLGTTSFGNLISALPGGNNCTGGPSSGGTGGTGGTVRFAGGNGGPTSAQSQPGSGGGAAGSILGVGGGGSTAIGTGGNAVGGYVSIVSSSGGASPFSNSFNGSYNNLWGAPDSLGNSSLSGANGTLRVGPTMPRFIGESLTGGGGSGSSSGTAANGGDGAGGGGSAGSAAGGKGGIFGGGGGCQTGSFGGGGGLGGGSGSYSSSGVNGGGGLGWMVVEW